MELNNAKATNLKMVTTSPFVLSEGPWAGVEEFERVIEFYHINIFYLCSNSSTPLSFDPSGLRIAPIRTNGDELKLI